MTLFYAILTYAMAAFNLYRGFNEGKMFNYLFAVLWLTLGIIYTFRYLKQRKQSKDKE